MPFGNILQFVESEEKIQQGKIKKGILLSNP